MIKKKTLVTSVILLSSFAMLTSSCSKSKDNNTDQLASLGKATVQGRVTAQLNDTTSATQYAPAGSTILAWIDSKDFVLYANSSETYARKYYSATVDASGNYTLTVDVSKYQPATVHIEPQQFEYNFVHRAGSTITTVRKIYNANSGAVIVDNGTTDIQDLMYSF